MYALCLGLTIITFMNQTEASLAIHELTPAYQAAGYQLCKVDGDDLIPVTVNDL